MKKVILLIIAISFSVFAGTGTDGFNFLKIKPSARATSIGDGFVAIADDVNACFYNPAGLAQIDNPEVSLMHMMYVAETSYEYGAAAMPVGDNLRVGLFGVYLNYGSIATTTENSSGVYTATTGSYSPSDIAFGLSLAYKLGDDLSLGINAKYAGETIDTSSASAILADIGALTKIEGVNIGAAIYNVGGNIGNDKAPMSARVGASYKFTVEKENDLTVAIGTGYTMASGQLGVTAGGEYYYEDFLVMRASYGMGYDLDSLNIGAGLRGNLEGMKAGIDYNFSMLGDLGSAHRVSLTVEFGDDTAYKKGKKTTTTPAKANKGKSNNTIQQKPKSNLKYYYKK